MWVRRNVTQNVKPAPVEAVKLLAWLQHHCMNNNIWQCNLLANCRVESLRSIKLSFIKHRREQWKGHVSDGKRIVPRRRKCVEAFEPVLLLLRANITQLSNTGAFQTQADTLSLFTELHSINLSRSTVYTSPQTARVHVSWCSTS